MASKENSQFPINRIRDPDYNANEGAEGVLDMFNAGEIVRLYQVRAKVLSGEISDLTIERKRLKFAKWLVEHDRMKL